MRRKKRKFRPWVKRRFSDDVVNGSVSIYTLPSANRFSRRPAPDVTTPFCIKIIKGILADKLGADFNPERYILVTRTKNWTLLLFTSDRSCAFIEYTQTMVKGSITYRDKFRALQVMADNKVIWDVEVQL